LVDIGVFYTLGVALVVAGIVVIIAAMVRLSMGETENVGEGKKSEAHAAGVIMIGPIPIVFGTDKKSVKVVLALALALAIVILILIVIYYWFLR